MSEVPLFKIGLLINNSKDFSYELLQETTNIEEKLSSIIQPSINESLTAPLMFDEEVDQTREVIGLDIDERR